MNQLSQRIHRRMRRLSVDASCRSWHADLGGWLCSERQRLRRLGIRPSQYGKYTAIV